MFENYHGFINLADVLKEEYNYNFVGLNDDFFSQDFVELEGFGSDALCWIKYRGKKYLLKKNIYFDFDVWGDLITSKIAEVLNIPHAKYRAGSLIDEDGPINMTISESFLSENDTLVLGREFFERHYEYLRSSFPDSKLLLMKKETLFLRWNNLMNVSSIVLKEDKNSKNMLAFIDMMLLDFITLESDRHPDNWGMIHNSNGDEFSPIFDSAKSFGIGIGMDYMEKERDMIQRMIYNCQNEWHAGRMDLFLEAFYKNNRVLFYNSPDDIISEDGFLVNTIPNVFYNFLASMDDDSLKYITNFFERVSKINIDNIISSVEKENGIDIDPEFAFYIIQLFEENFKNLRNILVSYKKGVAYHGERGSK